MKKLYSTVFIIACCASLTFSQSIDLGITAIIDPAPGASVDINYSDSIKFTLVNYGPAIAGTDTITFVWFVDGILQAALYSLQFGSTFPTSALATISAQVDFSQINNPTITVGNTYSICFAVAMLGIDTNMSNDSACANYTITTTGLESIPGQKSNIFLSNGQLNVDVTHANIVGSSMLSVYNMAGTLIHSEEINGDGHIQSTIDLTNESHGVYIFRLLSDGKLIESRKLMK